MKKIISIFTAALLTVLAYGQSGTVDVAYSEMNETNVAGAITNIDVDGLRDTYYSNDWQSYLQSSGCGLFGEANVRYSGYVIVIDGMEMGSEGLSFSDYITPDEIKSITVLKDASARILYGSKPSGVINIKTKRGTSGQKVLKAHYEYNLMSPIMYPSYLGSADYMELYNEACRNDGLSPRYSDLDIQCTRIGYDPVQYPDVDFYSDEFLRKFKQSHKARVEASGGNNRITYFCMLGFDYNTSLLKLGEAANANDNTVRVRGNVDLKITDWLKAKVDMAMVLNNGYSARGSFWSMASSRRPNENSLLVPVDRLGSEYDDIVEEARNQKSLIDGKYLIAGNSVYTSNLYGDSVLSGYNKETNMATNVNIGFDMDFGFVTPGLSFSTYAGIDNNNTYTISQKNSYAVYDVAFTLNPLEDLDDMSVTKYGENNFVGSQTIGSVSMYRKIGWYNVLKYSRVFGGRHDVDVVGTGRLSSYTTQGQVYPLKTMDYGLRANYTYDKRYTVEVATDLVASPYLQKEHRLGLAGSAALGWNIANEGFMKGGFMDVLKLKASYARLKNDPESYNYTRDTYTRGSYYYYADATSRNQVLNVSIGNPDLTFVDDYEMNLGVEAGILDNTLRGEFNYFTVRKEGVVSTVVNQYMSTLGGSAFLSRQNFAARSGDGYELNLAWDKSFSKDFSLGLDFGMVYYDATNDIVDEVDYGAGMEYYQKAGKSLSAIWGLVADGLYTQEEIDLVNDPDDQTLPKPSYGTVRAGDVKYIDQNGDGVINDLDMKVIGDSRSKYNYRFCVQARYKNFSLYLQTRAQDGGYALYTGDYYQVYGELKYPSYIKDTRWAYDPDRGVDTRETATYPRLSTSGSKNNFKNSTLWMASTKFFKIPVIQLTYHFSDKASKWMGMVSPNIYLRANNLVVLAPEREKLLLNVSSAPSMRTYSIGFKANF